MNSHPLSVFILALTVFLTACAPTERPAASRPADADAGAAGAVNGGGVARGAATTEPAAVAAPMVVQSEGGRDAARSPDQRAPGAPGVVATVPTGGDRRLELASRSQGGQGDARSHAVPDRAETGATTSNGPAKMGVATVAAVRQPAPSLPLAVVAAAHPQAFTPEQTHALVQLGESFLAETAATSPTPVTTLGDASPALTPEQIWAASTAASDERFKAMFGYEAFNSMQLKRAQDAYAEAKANTASK